MQPCGVNDSSASAISLIDPTHASPKRLGVISLLSGNRGASTTC
jgi:hypothetical protein